MALSVAPAANADSYASVAEADTYHTNYGTGAAWTALSDTNKEIALRRATMYIDGRFGSRFHGERTDPAQYLAWPRKEVFMYGADVSLDDELIPKAVKDAAAYLALQSTVVSLTDNVGATVRREKIGPIETEYAVSNGGSSTSLVQFPYVYTLLADYFRTGFGLTARRA